MLTLFMQSHIPCRRTRADRTRSVLRAVLVSVLLASAALAAMAASEAPLATVLATAGTNTVRPAGATASKALAVRASLYAGDIVSTEVKGKATLLFSDGSQARLNKNSRIEVTQPSSKAKAESGLFTVVWGEVWVRLRPGNKVKTKSAAAGALGTEFVVSVDEEETATLTVIEGSASFYNDYGAVVVGQSHSSQCSCRRQCYLWFQCCRSRRLLGCCLR